MKVFAAMLTRSPAMFQELLSEAGADEAIMREARAFQSKEVVLQNRLFRYQVTINRFLGCTFAAEPGLRRSVIMHFIGSMALGNSWSEAVRGMRRLLLDVLRFYVGDDPGVLAEGRLSLEEIAAVVRAR